MFQGMTAFLEAIDERVEQHAIQQQVAEEEKENNNKREEEVNEINLKTTDNHKRKDISSDNSPRGTTSTIILPTFPTQPALPLSRNSNKHFSNNFERNNSDVSRVSHNNNNNNNKYGKELGIIQEELMSSSLHEASIESSLLQRKDNEIDSLTRDIRRYQAAAEAAKQELLQRSLQVHHLEESLRETKLRFDEHKSKSLVLLEEKQREYEALRHRVESNVGNHLNNNNNNNNDENSNNINDNSSVNILNKRLEEFQIIISNLQKERDQLQANVDASRREVNTSEEKRLELIQQIDFLRLDIRGVQEALNSEIAAHQRSKILLQGRQDELNALRAAVEKNGGTFTATGALISLRGGGNINNNNNNNNNNSNNNSRDQFIISRQLLEKQNALESALREAAEWRRKCERATHRLEEERTTRVLINPSTQQYSHSHNSQQQSRDAVELRQILVRRGVQMNKFTSWIIECMSILDILIIRVGRVLKRQPILRMAAGLYIICLHIWFLTVFMMVPNMTSHTTTSK